MFCSLRSYWGQVSRHGSRPYFFLLLLCPAFLSLASCGGGGASTGGGTGGAVTSSPPVISAFSALPAVATPGQSCQLSWSVSGATLLSINGSVVSGSGMSVSPSATTTYTLTAGNAAGSTLASVTISVGSSATTFGDLKKADLGAGASLNGAVPFPSDNAWNRDVSAAPLDPNSSALIAGIGLGTGLHPDFGSGLYQGALIGIPYVVVSGAQPKVPILFTAYGDESDPGPYPVPPNAPIEGQQADGSAFGGDRHVLVIDRDSNRLYELGNAVFLGNGSWQASGGAVFHLDSNLVRPGGQPGWTSTDAAGLPIFPGLARYDEAASGIIRHALRFTVSSTRKAYVSPATHWASSSTSPNLPPMGMRVRLKASYVIPDAFSTETRAILQALKTYGMFVADNGSNWYISGAPDERWNNGKLVSELGSVKGSNFEVVRMDGLVAP